MDIREITEEVEREGGTLAQVRRELRKQIIGQDRLLDRLLIGLISNAHLLIEGVPGLAKTLAVTTLAQSIRSRFRRIQFTPDLLPADLVGTLVYHPGNRRVHHQEGADLRQHRACGRDQPRPRQGAERAVGGDAGTPGDDR